MAQVLRDLFEGTRFILDESGPKKFEGVLATVKGPFGLTEGKNRNDRIYTNEFWEYILKNKETSQRLQERGVIGELEHPNSIQTQLGHISHVVTELKVLPKEKTLYGEADILDTPSGRILHTLFKAGVKVGISSRGAGSLVERDSGDGKKEKYVKAEDYVFGGFDFVSDPSAPNAYPKLAEGQMESLVEALVPHAEQMKKDPDFYDPFLRIFGVEGVDHVAEQVEVTSVGTVSDEEDADLSEREATIADLRSKMRQMVEGHQEMSLRVAELQEQLAEQEDIRLQCEILSEASQVHRARTLSLGQILDQTSSELCEARERMEELRTGDHGVRKEMVLREQKLVAEISELESELLASQEEIETFMEKANSLGAELSLKADLVERKIGKIEGFRRELLESLSEVFNCDLKALTSELRPGFTPRDAVIRASECSRTRNSVSLPLEGKDYVVMDMTEEVAPEKIAVKEQRKATIRGVRGRKN